MAAINRVVNLKSCICGTVRKEAVIGHAFIRYLSGSCRSGQRDVLFVYGLQRYSLRPATREPIRLRPRQDGRISSVCSLATFSSKTTTPYSSPCDTRRSVHNSTPTRTFSTCVLIKPTNNTMLDPKTCRSTTNPCSGTKLVSLTGLVRSFCMSASDSELTQDEEEHVQKLYNGLLAEQRAALARSITLVESVNVRKKLQAQMLLKLVLDEDRRKKKHKLMKANTFRIGEIFFL